MDDPTESSICVDSDFDTRQSAKKICFTSGMELEVIDDEILRVTANSIAHEGTHKLKIWNYHVDSTGTKLWSVRATPATITVTGPSINFCSLEMVGQQRLTMTHVLS